MTCQQHELKTIRTMRGWDGRTMADDLRDNPKPVDGSVHNHFHEHDGERHVHAHAHKQGEVPHAHSTRT